MRTLAALLIGGALLVTGCSRTETTAVYASPFKATGSVPELMRALIIPTSDEVFRAQSETPADDAAWEKLQRSALVLAESGNLLMIGERARDAGNWRKDARALIDAASTAVTAARTKNSEQFSKAADDIYNACESCHKDYLPK